MSGAASRSAATAGPSPTASRSGGDARLSVDRAVSDPGLVAAGFGSGVWPVHRRVEHAMGMPISLAVRGPNAADDTAEEAWQAALEVLRDADRIFSTYRSDSVICRLGRGELRLADCPPQVGEVLDLAEQARQQSGGAFDVRRPGPDGGVVLDPSGVVKGWAVDRAARAFERCPDTDFCLSAGGDMVCRTSVPASPGWRIGIEDPADHGRLRAVAPIRNGAIATSGAAHRGAHIVDARSGRAPTRVASVTVIGPDLVWADIDATSAFARDADALRWLRGRPGRRGLVVWRDGTVQHFGA